MPFRQSSLPWQSSRPCKNLERYQTGSTHKWIRLAQSALRTEQIARCPKVRKRVSVLEGRIDVFKNLASACGMVQRSRVPDQRSRRRRGRRPFVS
jgi:hypothetical protein